MGFFSDLSKKTTELGKKTSETTGKIAREEVRQDDKSIV